MTEFADTPATGLLDGIKKNAGLTVTCGIILIVAGFLAIVSPLVAGLSITVMVGAMLVVSGIGQSFLAFKAGAFGKGLMVFVVGVLMAIAGFYMMSQPVAGLASLTLILMAYLLATGLLEIVVAFQLKPAAGWGMELFNGIVTLLLGIMLWRQFPLSGVWAVGILFGIKMIFSGWAFVFIGRAVKQVAKNADNSEASRA
jgi:uncharacterized membrane protein HdeD (DUF308 family)